MHCDVDVPTEGGTEVWMVKMPSLVSCALALTRNSNAGPKTETRMIVTAEQWGGFGRCDRIENFADSEARRAFVVIDGRRLFAFT